jgi:hypothetical protein
MAGLPRLTRGRVARFLAPDHPLHHLPKRVWAGQRVAHEGTTLLVDYGPATSRWVRHLFGHGLYTHLDRLLLHTELVASRFYADK